MRIGHDCERVVNMRAHDAAIADYVVQRYVVTHYPLTNAHLILGQLRALQAYAHPVAFRGTFIFTLVVYIHIYICN